MTRHETEQLFAGRIDAWRRHDVDALVQVHSENSVLESPIAGTVTGRAAIEGVYRGFLTSFPDLTVENPELVIEDGRVVQLLTFSGTNTGGFMSVPPTGKRFSFPAALVCTLRNGLIVHEKRIYDFTGFLMEIGVLKAKPA